MKTSSPNSEFGPKYWRGMDQLADMPEFREWMEREFPTGASEFADPVSRRHFVKIMSASFMLAGLGLTGCRRPVERIYPFAKMPENYVHGSPQYFATAMPSRRSAVPLVVKSSDGRPTKIEGNPDHPDSNGSADPMTQASLLNLYDPDRAMQFSANGSAHSRSEALDVLSALSKRLGDGETLAFLIDQSSSPSRARLQDIAANKFSNAKWFSYEPVELDASRQAATMAYGHSVEPYYKFDEAQVIVSVDCDFIGSEANAAVNIRRFSKGRQVHGKDDPMNRLYAIESLFTLTGMNADHRLRIAPGMIVPIFARLALNILENSPLQEALQRLSKDAAEHDSWVIPCAKDLKAAGAKGLVAAGHRLPLAGQLLAIALNEALGAAGHTVEYHEAPESKEGKLADLVTALNAGQIETLIILGGNPVYNAPADLDWLHAQAKAKTVIRLSHYEDETAWNPVVHAEFQLDLPAAHYLESWGDARTADGTLVPIQPLIEPMFGGITELETLALLAGETITSPYEIVRATFHDIGGSDEDAWKKFLHDGFLTDSAAAAASVTYDSSAVEKAIGDLGAPPPAPTAQKLDVVFHRSYTMDDGRYNNNGWLQELPDPITKLTWDNAILISPKTAAEFGLVHERGNQNQKFYDYVAEIELDGRKISGPIWIQPGMADYTVGLALGYGRDRTGRVGRHTGYNAYALRTSANLYYASGATLRKTGDTYQLSTTQSHWNMEGRPAVREAYLDEYRQHPDFAAEMNMEMPPVVAPLYPNPLDEVKSKALHQWGMSVDLNKCVGCSACMVACQSENNVPIVGKDMVGRSREMHWIRIDRYYAGPPEDPQAVTQPMLCQHCEAAPCENVCPVNATAHDEEGLNVMVYNRCVGTRYCSNNCPYKVRRFNFFDYNRRPLDQLYKSPLDPRNRTDGEWELLRWWHDPDRGSRPEDEWQLTKLVKNPDVTVRMRGVMEKCSFCLQRIEQAKIAQKVKARATDHIRLSEKEGTVPKTACQQACPAEAIIFGDISDPESTVSKLKEEPRNYKVLDFLNTKPRVTYLANLRNPNPEMPDYKAHSKPYTTEEYLKEKRKGGSQLEEPAAEKGAS